MPPGAAAPTVEQALKLMPTQKDVEIDTPREADMPRRRPSKARRWAAFSAWIVRDAAGQMLRKFADTNNDNVVDQWCYFRDGIEVYRDIDSNFNGKADQYRWLNTAGTRWGTGRERGRQDRLLEIDLGRGSLGRGRPGPGRSGRGPHSPACCSPKARSSRWAWARSRPRKLTDKVAKAGKQFAETARQQKIVGPKTTWIHFGGTRPGIVPSGTEGSTKDLIVYENVMAMVDTAGKHAQVQVGTLVRVGDMWRVIDLPRATADDKTDVAAGFFIRHSGLQGKYRRNGRLRRASLPVRSNCSPIWRRSTSNWHKPRRPPRRHSSTPQRADLVEKLAEASSPEDRGQWLRQLADSASASAQSGSFPAGVERLQALCTKIAQEPDSTNLAAYIKFRYLTAEYGLSLQGEKARLPQDPDQLAGEPEAVRGRLSR